MKKIILLILLSLLIFSLILYHTERLGLAAVVISLMICALIIMAASYLMEHAYIKDINSKDHHE
ncbi:hypothetical protein [Acinetobacter sp. UBA2581]|uniref:hypothetical protein n=1 Tax=Acinetobacter sp. UBA2581 TaxID=1945932 RepID=UPI00258091DB|nr:hypothetical protein [Acinetobacter sp. UBA2581]